MESHVGFRSTKSEEGGHGLFAECGEECDNV